MKFYSFLLYLFISCCPAIALAQNDCPDAIMVCGTADFIDLDADGPGNVFEITAGNACSSGENNTVWLEILIKDGGTLGFTITPPTSDTVIDFDFWMFGPDVACNNLGTAIRCSTTNPNQAGLTYNTTGMNEESLDVSEGPGPDGDAFINWITVQGGEHYYIIVDRPHGFGNFNISFNGTATFHDVPVFLNPDNIPLDMSDCDANNQYDPQYAFDLTQYEAMFIGSQTFVDITYHLSSNDVTNGINPIESPEAYHNIQNPQTIYARMTNTVTGCFSAETFTLSRDVLPAGEPDDILLCDPDNNGYEVFNLTQNNTAVIDGQPGCVVTYYNNLQNAIAGTGPIATPAQYQNQMPGTETIYVRLMKTNGCLGYDLKTFTITASGPELINPAAININLTDCDDFGPDDQSTLFDLTTHQAMFNGSQQNTTFTYHTNTNDAVTGNNPISSPQAYANTANPQTVYVRIKDNTTNCSTYLSFILTVSSAVEAASSPFFTCDYDGDGQETANLAQHDPAIQNGNTTALVTYYISEADAENETGAITSFTATYTAQTLWARLEGTQGCFGHDVVSFTVQAAPVPVANNPQNIDINIIKCDDDAVDDGATAFNLTTHQGMFTGSQADVQFTYYTTFENAQNNISPIANPQAYVSNVPLKTIYVRMAYSYGCPIFFDFTLEIENLLFPGQPANLALCDDNKTGFNTFNLSQNDALVKGTTDIATNVTYYTTQANAQNAVNPLPVLYQNQTQYGPQVVWARLESANNCRQHTLKHFTITVIPLPYFENPAGITTDLSDCDDYGPDDQSTLFNLTTHQTMFKGNQINMQFSYYTSAGDAELGINPIQNPQAYVNLFNPQTVYVAMKSTTTGCRNILPFDLIITNPVTIAPFGPLVQCDADGDGLELFDLTVNNVTIQNGNTTAAVTYYNSQLNAQNETGAITTFMATTTPQTLWARLENTVGCYGHDIISFTVQAMPLPVFNITPGTNINLALCDEDADSNNATAFNLTTHQDMFIGTQTGMEVTYYITASDAQNETSAIANPLAYANTAVLQTIYVRMENASGCFTTTSFTIEILNPLYPGQPVSIVLCDDNKNGFNLFDLTQNDAAIINSTANGVVSYYATQADAQNGVNPITGLHQNQWAYVQQIIWARLESSAGCLTYRIVAFTVRVQRLPQFINPQNIVFNLQKCDDDAVDDLSTTFNLTTHTAMFLASQPDIAVSYHTDTAEATLGTNALINPEAFANISNPQTVYIRFYSTITNCVNVLPFDIEVINPLEAGQPENLYLCDAFENGHQMFDLWSNTPAIQNGQADTQVVYYANLQDAQNEVNPLNQYFTNAQAYTTQTIWARIENINGCFGHDITSFTIEVLQLPDITYTLQIHDFTVQDNAITINVNLNPTDFEFSLDGVTYTDNNFFNHLSAGVYTVYIRSKNGCKEVSEEVVILNYPKYFSPNEDGAGDTWNVYFISNYPGARVNIFDRYGKLIKSYWGTEKGWDGTYNGRNLFATDYWFVLEMESGRNVKGHFSLIR